MPRNKIEQALRVGGLRPDETLGRYLPRRDNSRQPESDTDFGISRLYITHDLTTAHQICDRRASKWADDLAQTLRGIVAIVVACVAVAKGSLGGLAVHGSLFEVTLGATIGFVLVMVQAETGQSLHW